MCSKKVITLVTAMTIAASVLAGCGGEKNDGKVSVSVGTWPTDAQPEYQESYSKLKEEFEANNPDIIIEPDTYHFSPDTFMVKASGHQIPDIYQVPFTEPKKIIGQGFAADITEELEELGWLSKLNPDLKDLVTDEDGRYYGVPISCYAQGLYINKSIFREAGLINADGSIMYPETFEEMAEFAEIIKEKTGKAGYVIPTVNNCGGWHFLNIAWSYGTSFMEEQADGSYKATFDTQSTRDALQYIYDLKWKHNVLPDNTVIDNLEMQKLFATGQVAMAFMSPPGNDLVTTYGMSIDDIAAARMPAGPHGRFSQMGGELYMFSSDASHEEIKAGLKWIAYRGTTPEITEADLVRREERYKVDEELGNRVILGKDVFNVWLRDAETESKLAELGKKYSNVKEEDYADYFSFEGVTIKPEEPMCCQELYAALDKCIQEVVTNKDADISGLITQTNNDFQRDYLDKQ